MKAAIVTAPGKSPIYGDIAEPTAVQDLELINVHAAALSQLSKSRSTGAHYSSGSTFPSIAGVDGVGLTADGRRVYFALPEAPNGALAQQTLVRASQCIPLPEGLDEITAAAIANPGMSCWAALVERAKIQPGETVLINGATGSAGSLAVQVARHLGAAKVIATGRNPTELEKLKSLGADVTIAFDLETNSNQFEQSLKAEFGEGIDIVLDYLWGQSARIVITAIVKAVEDAHPIRFVQIGAAAGQDEISLPAAALRSSSIQLMGSGLKSVPFPKLLEAIGNVFAITQSANLQIATRTMPLAEIEAAWQAPSKPRVVVTI